MARVEADGLITNLKHIPLMVSAADCSSVGIYDKGGDGKGEAIGLLHSGWRGTLLQIIQVMISEMKARFDSKPENMMVFIGPGVGPSFEVDQGVYEKFRNTQQDGIPLYSPTELEEIFKPNLKKKGTYFFNNKKAIEISAIKAGILLENIEVSQYDTMENNEIFTSETLEGNKERDTDITLLVLKSGK